MCSPTPVPSLAPTPTLDAKIPQLKLRLDGSIDSWLPSDIGQLQRRLAARLGVQNTEDILVEVRAGSAVVVVTILAGAQPNQNPN